MKNKGFSAVEGVLVVLLIAVLGGIGYFVAMREDSATTDTNTVTTPTPAPTPAPANDDEQAEEAMDEDYMDYPSQATLIDVTEGATLLGVEFDGNSSGMAYQQFADGEYSLYATFENLPVLEGDEVFYEGWIVGGDEGVVSTGALELVDGSYINDFSDSRDLSDSTRYVLTIEPNDGDPMPADHVVEGDFEDK